MFDGFVKVEDDKMLVDLTGEKTISKEEKECLTRSLSYFNILSNIKSDKMYKIISAPDGKMTKYADGTILPVVKGKDGKIAGHAKLKEVYSGQTCKWIATQFLLIYISCQLAEVRSEMNQIEKGAHNDRISKVEGVIKTCKDNDYEMNGHELVLASQLREGIVSLQYNFQKRMCEIPSPVAGLFDNWFGDKNAQCMEFITDLNNSMYWILKGYECIIHLYEKNNIRQQLENTNNLENLFDDMCGFLGSIKYDEIINCSRALPYDPNNIPEMFWEDLFKFTKKIPEMRDEYIKFIKCNLLELQIDRNLI